MKMCFSSNHNHISSLTESAIFLLGECLPTDNVGIDAISG